MAERLIILGAGESGVGSAILGKKKGYEVFVSDFGKIKETYKEVLIHHEIEWEEGGHTEDKILKADVVMKSPGIADTIPIVKRLIEQGVEVISEIEFASRFTDAKIIGITGSNGKTTTATMTYEILKQGGLPVALGGNIGTSFAEQVATGGYDPYVLELSSFQLDGIKMFRPHIALLMNITPDHLDRYDNDFEKYVASKFRIAMNQTEDDYFIYDADDEVITSWMEKHPIRSQLVPFSVEKKLETGGCIENDNIKITIDNNLFIMPIATLSLQGTHNVKNAMAASAVAQLLKIRKDTIRECMEHFQAVEHRLEKVLTINKVTYINDSKATNVNATFYALESMETPTVWIVGGVDKGNDYEPLLPLVNEKVKAIICIGVDNDKIVNAFGNIVEMMIETHSMDDAVQVAYRVADKGETVLLSPACASFDRFENYEDRGNQFKAAIRKL